MHRGLHRETRRRRRSIVRAFENVVRSAGGDGVESKTRAEPSTSSSTSSSSSSAPRSFALEARWTAAAATFAALGHLARYFSSVHVPTHVAAAPAYVCATCAVYSLCRRVPPRWQRVGAFPTITGGVAMALISAAMGALAGLGGDPAGGVRLYVAGAGATLLWFVPPAVLGLAFRVHARRRDVASNFAPVFAAVALAVPGGMFLGACVGRLAGLAPDLVLATIPKCTTTGLAVCMAERLGVDPSLVAAGCALSGTAGLAAGRATMDALRVRGATARGVATGVSSHAAGTAALAAGGRRSRGGQRSRVRRERRVRRGTPGGARVQSRAPRRRGGAARVNFGVENTHADEERRPRACGV